MNKKNIKKILLGTLIGFIFFPAVTLGGSFISSLIQGKTAEEAIQILAQQINLLIGRVETLESKQEIQEEIMGKIQILMEKEQNKQEAYEEFRRVFDKVWLYGKGKDEVLTIQATREYCQNALKEGRTKSPFCPLADELEITWEIYQKKKKELEDYQNIMKQND